MSAVLWILGTPQSDDIQGVPTTVQPNKGKLDIDTGPFPVHEEELAGSKSGSLSNHSSGTLKWADENGGALERFSPLDPSKVERERNNTLVEDEIQRSRKAKLATNGVNGVNGLQGETPSPEWGFYVSISPNVPESFVKGVMKK